MNVLKLATLAEMMGLTTHEATVLPATIEGAARIGKMIPAKVADLCWFKPELRDYIAKVCREVAATETSPFKS